MAEISRLSASVVRDWRFFKDDHEDARANNSQRVGSIPPLEVIAMRRPVENVRYGFFSRTLMFGAVAAALRYDLFARLLCEIAPQLFGAPIICFFDDFGALVPDGLAPAASELLLTLVHSTSCPSSWGNPM